MEIYVIKQIDNYLTDNINVRDSFFEGLLKKYTDDTIKLYFCYHLLKNRKKTKSIRLFESIKEKDYNKSLFLMLKALLFLYDDIRLCKEVLQESISVDNKNKWSYLELFYLLKDTNENYLAWDYLERAIKIDENFNEAKYQRILQYDSIENCSLIINDILTFPQTYINEYILNTLGSAYYNCNQVDNSIKILKGSLAIKETPEAYYILGSIEYNVYNNFEKALLYYNLSLKINSLYLDCLNSKAWLLFDIGKIKKAEEIFKQIITIDQSQISFIQLIQFYLKTNNLENVFIYNEAMLLKYGKDYISDTFEILYYLKNDNKIFLNERVKLFKENYSDYQIEWLKNMILNYGAN